MIIKKSIFIFRLQERTKSNFTKFRELWHHSNHFETCNFRNLNYKTIKYFQTIRAVLISIALLLIFGQFLHYSLWKYVVTMRHLYDFIIDVKHIIFNFTIKWNIFLWHNAVSSLLQSIHWKERSDYNVKMVHISLIKKYWHSKDKNDSDPYLVPL